MLETSQERVKLLRAGFSGKSIEKLYIQCNNFKIVNSSTFFELVEVDFPSGGAKMSISDSCLVELF
jgi:hypothetical protein